MQFPDNNKMQEFTRMVQLHKPSVNDIIKFMDGVLLMSECMDKRIEQNAFYCGYDCNTMINNVFVYGPDGKVFFVQLTSLAVGLMVR